MGRPGFNTRANNANGYATEAAARAVMASKTVWRCCACGAPSSIGDKPVAKPCKCAW